MSDNYQLIDSIYTIKHKITEKEYQNIMNGLNEQRPVGLSIHEYMERFINYGLYINPPNEEKEDISIGYHIYKNACRVCLFYFGFMYFFK